jgi:hypothetical protein
VQSEESEYGMSISGYGASVCLMLQVMREGHGGERTVVAGNAARDNKKTRIVPRHIQLTVRNDEELSKLLGDVTIANGGVMPNIHNLLLLETVLLLCLDWIWDWNRICVLFWICEHNFFWTKDAIGKGRRRFGTVDYMCCWWGMSGDGGKRRMVKDSVLSVYNKTMYFI